MTTARERLQHPSRREYRAGMVVRYDGRRWEIDSVEFWERDERLSLKDVDGSGRVRTYEAWASYVSFEDNQAEAVGEDIFIPLLPGMSDDLASVLADVQAMARLYTGQENYNATVAAVGRILQGFTSPDRPGPAPEPAPAASELAASPTSEANGYTLEWPCKARSQAPVQPSAARMTPELERLLVQAEETEVPYRLRHGCNEAAYLLTAMCSAVRAQATSAVPAARDLPKVRELIQDCLVNSTSEQIPIKWMVWMEMGAKAAKAELDAQPKPKREAVPVEAIRYALSYLRSDTTKTNLLANIDTIDRWLAAVEGGR